MGKHFSDKEVTDIVRMHEVDGLSHKDIALKLGRVNKKGEPNSRSIMDQYAHYKRLESLKEQNPEMTAMSSESIPPLLPTNVQLVPKGDSVAVKRFAGDSETVTVPIVKKQYVPTELILEDSTTNLSEMSKTQRYESLKKTVKVDARGRHTFGKILNEDECELFCQEYFRVLREQDSLTNVEEQQLFTAILNYVLYHRALEMDRTAYTNWVNHKAQNPIYDTRWKDEVTEKYNQYQKGLESLKLSRNQRLKDMARSGNTFLDYAEILSKKENQNSIADEIMAVEKMTADEVKRLQENGWMLFGGSKENNPEVNYGQDITLVPEVKEQIENNN